MNNFSTSMVNDKKNYETMIRVTSADKTTHTESTTLRLTTFDKYVLQETSGNILQIGKREITSCVSSQHSAVCKKLVRYRAESADVQGWQQYTSTADWYQTTSSMSELPQSQTGCCCGTVYVFQCNDLIGRYY